MAEPDGVLSDRELEAMIADGAIRAENEIDMGQIQPASLDLRLADDVYRIRASFLPGKAGSVGLSSFHMGL